MSENKNELLEGFISVYMSSLKYLDEFVSEPATEYNLSFEQYLILHSVAVTDQITLMDIAKARQVTRSAISRQIKVLLKREYIYQEPDENDRRRLYLHLTDEGEKAEADITKRTSRRFDSWIDVFGEKKAQEILQFIKEFSAATNLEKKSEE